MSRATFAAAGVVLHMGTTGDAHRVVDVLTADHGRMTLLARGARASRKRFAGILDVFASLTLQIQPGQGMPVLQGADALRTRLGIRQDLERIARASTLCRCVRALVAPKEAAQPMFVALEQGLDLLDRGAVAEAAAAYPRLLAAAGILPSPSGVPVAGVRAVLQGAPVQQERTAREVEAWTCAWVARHTGTPVAAVSSALNFA